MDLVCKQVGIWHLKRALGNLSTEIDAFYRDTLARIDENEDYQDLIKKLLTWLLYANPPLRTEALAQALAMESDLPHNTSPKDLAVDIRTLSSMLEGLVLWPDYLRYNYTVLSHETVDAFLRKNTSWLSGNGERLILEACLTSLSLNENLNATFARHTNIVHPYRTESTIPRNLPKVYLASTP